MERRSTKNERHRTNRFEFHGREALNLIIRVDGKVVDGLQPGRVLDLSRGGAKLILPGSLSIKSRFQLEIDMANLQQPIVKIAEVCSERPMNGLKWLIGCTFEEELSEEVLSQLASDGFLERRRDTRTATAIPAKAQWELASNSTDVTLVNFSAGGFAIHSPEPARLSNRVLLQLEGCKNNSPLLGKICWQSKKENQWSIGCSFVNKNGHRNLLSQLPPDMKQIPCGASSTMETVQSRTWIVVTSGLVAAALLTLLMIYQ